MNDSTPPETFGERIRRLRESREIGLRRFAETIGITAAYLSKIERSEFPPPSEEKVKTIAEALGEDTDELLALAGRVASDLSEIIRRQPRALALLLRSAEGLPSKDIEQLTSDAAKRLKNKR